MINWKLINKEWVNAYESEILIYEHIKTKAQVSILKNNNFNISCATSFKTKPFDNSGVFHVIEHCIADNISNSEVVNTTALVDKMTTEYKMMFNVKSEFENLFDIHLESIFNPEFLRDKNIFKQEIRYDLDENRNISYNGIAYNEIINLTKKDYSIENKLFGIKHMYIEGLKKSMEKLTYKKVRDVYYKYYHPSNAHFYIYGDIEIRKVLEKLNTHISRYKYKDFEDELVKLKKPNQRKYDYIVNKQKRYYRTVILAYALNLKKFNNPFEELIITKILKSKYLKEKLTEIEYFRGFNTTTTNMGNYRLYVCEFAGVYPDKTDDVKNKFEEIIDEFTKRETTKKYIDIYLNKRLLMIKADSAEKNVFGRISSSIFKDEAFFNKKNHNDINLYKTIENIKKIIKKPLNLNKLINQNIVKNENYVIEIVKYKSEDAVNKLEEKKIKKTDKIIKDIREFKEWQNKRNKKNIRAINFNKNKIDVKYNLAKIKKYYINDVEILECKNNLKDVVFLKIMFDLNQLDEEELRLFSVLKHIMDIFNQVLKYDQFSTELFQYTSGVKKEFFFNEYRRLISFDTYFFSKNTEKVLNILDVYINEFGINDKEELKNSLKNWSTFIKGQNLRDKILSFSYNSILSTQDLYEYLYVKMKSYSNYNFYEHCYEEANNDLEKFVLKLTKLSNKVFNKDNLIIFVNSKASINEELFKFINKFKKENNQKNKVKIKNCQKARSRALKLNLKNNINYRNINIKNINKENTYLLDMLCEIIENKYLHKKIRKENGAYTVRVSYNQKNSIMLTTKEDPNIKKTYDIFSNIGEALENLKTEELDEYIYKYLLSLKQQYNAKKMGDVSLIHFLNNITEEDIKTRIDKVKNCTVSDLKKIINKIAKSKDVYDFTIASEEILKMTEKKFDEIYGINDWRKL